MTDPFATRIFEGEKVKRSAAIEITLSGLESASCASAGPTRTAVITASSLVLILEPPSQAYVDSVPGTNHGTRVAVEYVVELQGNVGIRFKGETGDYRGTIEFRQRLE